MEENLQDVIQEEVSTDVEETTAETPTETTEEQEQFAYNKPEENFKRLRERTEAAERRAQEIEERLRYIENERKQAQAKVDQEDYEDETDLADRGYVKKTFSSTQQQLDDIQFKLDHPDALEVLSTLNIEYLRKNHPHLAESLAAEAVYSRKLRSTYDAIKSLGIGEKIRSTLDVDQRIDQNMKKPRAAASVTPQTSNSPLSEKNRFANGLTPEVAKALREEMQTARRKF